MTFDFAGEIGGAGRLMERFAQDPEGIRVLLECEAILSEAVRERRKVLICGNGGSLADAMHFAEEFSGRFRKDRPPYPAIALSDPTHMSCVANDYGFAHVFSRQVEALGHEGDVLIALSTSGASENILEALKAGRARGMCCVGFLGKGGGPALALCDLALLAPGETSDRIQEIHMLCLHLLVQAVEETLGHA